MNDKNRAGRPGSRRFEKALTFTTSLISRLDADPGAIDPTLYPIKNWESLLWALQQQYIKVCPFVGRSDGDAVGDTVHY